jgi:hypothetical protein
MPHVQIGEVVAIMVTDKKVTTGGKCSENAIGNVTTYSETM